jgi:hypothetical protein
MLEIWRVLAPGGIAVLTAHGPTFLPIILANLKDIATDIAGTIRTTLIDEDAFIAFERSAGSNFSANAMTGKMFARICQPFDVVVHKPRYGLMGVHDTYVITKKAAGPLAFVDHLAQAPLSGKRCTVTVDLSLAGQSHFRVLARATNLFSATTLHVMLRVSGKESPLGEAAVLSLPDKVSLTSLDAAHAPVTIDDLPVYHGAAVLSAEVYSDAPMDGATLFLSKAMLF